MIHDAATLLSGAISPANVLTGQTVTGAASVLSTNTIDLLQTRDIGEGENVNFLFRPSVTFTGLTALEMQVIAADDAGLTANVNVLGSTGPVPVAGLTAGLHFVSTVSGKLNSKGQRYIGLRYIPTGTGTAGAMIASIVGDIQDGGTKTYPSGFAVI